MRSSSASPAFEPWLWALDLLFEIPAPDFLMQAAYLAAQDA